MSYRTVLVSLNDTANAPGLVDVAVKIALREETHLVGLHVIPALDIPSVVGSIDLPATIFEDHRIVCEQRANMIRDLFSETCKREQLSFEWQTVSSMTTQIGRKVVEHARYADITLVSQGDPDGPETGQADLPEQLLMESGRPVLVVPLNGSFKTVGEYPLVAWNGSRESARAAFDAVPLMKRAREVLTFRVNPERHAESSPDIAGGEIATSLARYGINVKATHADSGSDSIDTVLLTKVRDTGADLLVMGGYGRSRLREYIFGGATHRILKNMTVPVLMSH